MHIPRNKTSNSNLSSLFISHTNVFIAQQTMQLAFAVPILLGCGQ